MPWSTCTVGVAPKSPDPSFVGSVARAWIAASMSGATEGCGPTDTARAWYADGSQSWRSGHSGKTG